LSDLETIFTVNSGIVWVHAMTLTFTMSMGFVSSDENMSCVTVGLVVKMAFSVRAKKILTTQTSTAQAHKKLVALIADKRR
jgi:hypothetical protein